MKHRVKSATSIALVVAMLATSVLSGGGVAFAGSEDLVQMETVTEESGIVTESTSAPEITVTDDGISVSDVSDSIEIETVEAKTGATVFIQEEDISVDNSRLLSVSAFNKSDVDGKFKLYFWDGELPEEKENWNFSDPNMDVFLVSDSEELTGELTVNNTVQDADLHFVQDKTEDTVKARYVLADLPAGSRLTFTVRVDADAACDVSAITSVDDALFEGVSLSWDTEDIVIESETETIVIEPETNNIVIEDSIVIEGGETETEAEINSEMETELSVETETDVLDQETGQETLDDPESVDTEREDDTDETETETSIETETDVLDENTGLADSVESEISELEEESDVVDVEPEEDTERVDVPEEMDEEAALDEPETEEHFLDAVDGTEELDVSDFVSMRLVVLSSNPETVIDPEHVIANYDTIYLLQYGSVEQAMNAYVYYLANAEAVEPDAVLETASEVLSDDDIDMDVTEEQNPISALSDEADSKAAQKADRVIALIDTGASESANVIDRVSLIDDVLEGSNSHANDMVDAMVSQNPDARILSIRAMGDDGRGTVSSIVAAMEYAINQNVSIINLSLYAKTNLLNSVLESEIQKAVDLGIDVVGAAGNDGADVAGYMPGSVAAAWIIGAANTDGTRVEGSNYGETVDYNVVADTTSEAAAKFSGYISLYGVDHIAVNDGMIYATDYEPEDIEVEEPDTDDDVIVEPDHVDNEISEEELSDIADSGDENWSIEGYPGYASTWNHTEYIWTKDTDFDFATYNPYGDHVTVAYLYQNGDVTYEAGSVVEVSYKYTLVDTPDYYWTEYVTFTFVDDRDFVTAGSDLVDRILPEYVNQDRNEGYGGIVPTMTGETVDGKTYTVLLNDESFDVTGLLLDYNPHTFKVNHVDEGDFDISVPGSYTVIYEVSYFMYYDYTWYVKNTVDVNDPDTMEPGLYLTSKESTVMFTRKSDGLYAGYGDFVKVTDDAADFIVDCYDEEYEIEVSASNDLVADDICTFSDLEDHAKLLSIKVPDEITGITILSLYRPNYQSTKMHTGGGWQNSEYTEEELDQFSADDFAQYEDVLSGESSEDAYMKVAASWTNVASTSISGHLISGNRTGTNYGWDYNFPCTNYGTVKATEYADQIVNWANTKGFVVDKSKVKDFTVACASGHDYMGMKVNARYNCSISVTIQQNGSNFRIKLSVWVTPSSDNNGNYQTFGGTIYITATNEPKGYLVIYKRFKNPALQEATSLIGELRTTFSIYNDAACTDYETSMTVNDPDDYKTSGKIELEPGTYWVKETRRINGTILNKDIYGPIEIIANDTKTLGEDAGTSSSLGSNGWIYNKPFYFAGKLATKRDKNDWTKPVKGAIYRLQYSEQNDANFKAKYTWYFETDENGDICYDEAHLVGSWNGNRSDALLILNSTPDKTPGLPGGYLRFQEVESPLEYKLDSTVYSFKLSGKKDVNGEYTIEKAVMTWEGKIVPYLTFEEEPNVSHIEIKKTDGSGAWNDDLKGAEFSLYKGNTKLETITINSSEYYAFQYDCIGGETYVIKETKTPPGKVTAADITVTIGTGISYKEIYQYTIENSDAPKVYIIKDSTASDEILNLSSYSKANAEFGIYTEENCTTKIGTLITGENGETTPFTLPCQELDKTYIYWVREDKAPAGHKLNDTPVSFTVTLPNDDGRTIPVEISDDPEFCEHEFNVEKKSSKGNAIANVVFKVEYFDAASATGTPVKTWYLQSDGKGIVMLDDDHKVRGWAEYKSDSFFTWNGKIVIPIGGYLQCTEVEAPAEYIVDTTPFGFATTKTVELAKKWFNTLEPVSMKVVKYGTDGKTPLPGVTFKLEFISESEPYTADAVPTFKPALKVGESTTAKTDAKGEINFTNLDQGTYRLVETETIPGYSLLKDPIEFTLPIKLTASQIASQGNVNVSAGKVDPVTGLTFFYECTYEVTDMYNFEMPMSGGMGTWKYGFIGIAMIAVLGVGVTVCTGRHRKRRVRKA